MDKEHESEVVAPNTTLNDQTAGACKTYKQNAEKETSHFYVFDDIEPYSVTYTYTDETNRKATPLGDSGPLQSTITDPNVSDEPLAELQKSTFAENHPLEDTRDVRDDNGLQIPPNIPKGNAGVHHLHNPPDGLRANPMYASSSRQQAGDNRAFRDEGNAGVHHLYNPPDGLRANPMYASSSRQQAGDNRAFRDDNGPRIPPNTPRGNAGVHNLRNPQDGLRANPMYVTSGRQQAEKGILAGLFHIYNAQQYGMQMHNHTHGSDNRTTFNVTIPPVTIISSATNAPRFIFHGTYVPGEVSSSACANTSTLRSTAVHIRGGYRYSVHLVFSRRLDHCI
uniref:Uncharacterized protein n=1 Tax=Branchiostoma floridae TaxID=7739 RepID=C3YFN1_BRAFL|eukprot:XP_002604984.1 hypothetical protein BRAFLDRAFT_92627 [Branchiostoma floridae]